VVRGGVEPPTFRFSGWAMMLVARNGPAWEVPSGCSRLPVVVAVAVTVVVDAAGRRPARN
jgi:hypothetical protein